MQNFKKKQKCLNLGSKIPDLHILVMEFENTIVITEICVLEFLLLKSFVQKNKSLHLGPKMLDFGIFEMEIGNNIVIFEISTLEFF